MGWGEGRNIQIDYRYGVGNAAMFASMPTELVALAPDVILARGTSTMTPLLQATRTVPIVFVMSPIRSAPASSIVCRGRAATPPGFSSSNTA